MNPETERKYPEKTPQDAAADRFVLTFIIVGLLVVMPLVGVLHQQRVEEHARAPASSATMPTQPEDALSDLAPDAGVSGRKAGKPEPWQKRPSGSPPRCGPKEKEILGACYRRAHPDDYSPPCEYPTVQSGSTCWYAIKAEARPDSSIRR